jgi:hypothetical protein
MRHAHNVKQKGALPLLDTREKRHGFDSHPKGSIARPNALFPILSYGAMAARRTVNAMVRGSSPRRTARWRCTKSERTSKVSGVTHDYVRSVN